MRTEHIVQTRVHTTKQKEKEMEEKKLQKNVVINWIVHFYFNSE